MITTLISNERCALILQAPFLKVPTKSLDNRVLVVAHVCVRALVTDFSISAVCPKLLLALD